MKVQLQYEDRKINYNITGTGDTIVLLHGFLESSAVWNDFTETLKKAFKVISIDLPGHGKTEVFSDVHTMELMAEIVNLILETQHITQCFMVGHSMGGYVTLAFSGKYPEKLKGICLLHSHAGADSDDGRNKRIRTIDIVEKDRISFIGNFIPDLFAPENISRFSKQIDVLKNTAKSTSKEGITAALRGMMEREERISFLSQTDLPVLFITGKKDKRIPLDMILSQIGLPAHAEALILDRVGHMGYIEAKEIVLETIRDFCRKISAFGTPLPQQG